VIYYLVGAAIAIALGLRWLLRPAAAMVEDESWRDRNG
jgi:hypothetical protein